MKRPRNTDDLDEIELTYDPSNGNFKRSKFITTNQNIQNAFSLFNIQEKISKDISNVSLEENKIQDSFKSSLLLNAL